MTILRERKTWKREPRPKRSPGLLLTDEERENVKTALRFMRARLGGAAKLAEAMKVRTALVEEALAAKGKQTAATALAVARAAEVPIDDVLAGRFPPTGACPHCGRM